MCSSAEVTDEFKVEINFFFFFLSPIQKTEIQNYFVVIVLLVLLDTD